MVKSALSRKSFILLAAAGVLLAAGIAYATQQIFDVAIQGDVLLSVTAEDPLVVYSGDGMTPIDSGDTVDFGTVELDYWGTGPIPLIKVLVVNTSQTPEQVVVVGDGGDGIVPVFGPTMDDMVPAPDNSFVLQPEGETGDRMWGYVGLTFPDPTDGAKSTTIIFRATDEIAPVPDPTPTPTPHPGGDPVVDRLKVALPILRFGSNDPILLTDEGGQIWPAFEGLVEYDKGASYAPSLAESWTVSDDALVWTFKIREGIQFHDGWGEMTTADVLHTTERHTRDESQSIHIGFYRDQVVPGWNNIDEYNFSVTFDSTIIDLHQILSDRWWNLIQSKAQFDAEGQDGFEANPAGTGRYELVDQEFGVSNLFERVTYDHWRGPADFPQLQLLFVNETVTRLALMLSGGAHMTRIPGDEEETAEDC